MSLAYDVGHTICDARWIALAASRAERALDQRQLECILACWAAPTSSCSVMALAPRSISASAASTRHGLCATPPNATRPVPSR